MPDSISPRLVREEPGRLPPLAEPFLPPPGFVWQRFVASDGAVLRCGHLPLRAARAECVIIGGFGEFLELQFETVREFAARGIAVWGLEWRGQGDSARPERWRHRARPRNFDRDAAELAEFAATRLTTGLPRIAVAHSMGGAIALLCLRDDPGLFDAAILSAPMLGLHTAGVRPALLRCVTAPARFGGFGLCFIPGTRYVRAKGPPSPERSRLTSDPERCRLRYAWTRVDPALRLGQPTYGWLDSAFGLIERIGRPEFLAAVTTPILLGSPRRDIVVNPAAHRRAARLLPDCTLVEMPASKHEPFHECDAIRHYWFGQIDRFLAERLFDPAA